MLPREFLIKMAHNYELSKNQEQVFLLRYGEEMSYKDVADKLGTTTSACLKRMGEVYEKFKVEGISRGKENRLRIFLSDQLKKEVTQASAEKTVSISVDDDEPQIIDNEPQSVTIATSRLVTQKRSSSKDSVPRIYQNLPHRIECSTFIGRQWELKRLLQLLSFDHSAHLISVDGIGGVGKTTLVLEAAYRCLKASMAQANSKMQTFEGIPIPKFEAFIFTSAKKKHLVPVDVELNILERQKPDLNLRDIYRKIAYVLDRLDISGLELANQLDLISDSLKSQRTLLIVDNLETIEDPQEVLSFLYDLPSSVKVIITSREQALFVPIRLDSLPESDGLSLLRHELQEKKASGIEIELSPEEEKALYKATCGIPAAIVYSVGQLASGYLLKDILSKLTNASGDVARFCFENSVQSLRAKPSHRILITLPLFPSPIKRDTIAKIAFENADKITTDELADALAQLQQLSLVRQRKGRYSLLSLAREYAKAELHQEPEFEQKMRARWLNYYLELSQEYDNFDENKWYFDEYSNLDLEWENLHDVMEWCIANNKYDDALTLWRRIKGYTYVRGHWDERLDWTKWLLYQAEGKCDKSTVAEVMCDKGWSLALSGQPQRLKDASKLLETAWELGNYPSIVFQLELAIRRASVYTRLQMFDQARNWLSEAENILRKGSVEEQVCQRQQARILYYQAEICFKLDNYSQAKELYQQALKLAEEAGWQRGANAIQNWLAEIALKLGNLEEAKKLLERGLPVAENYQDKRSIAFYQYSFARLEQLEGNLEQARYWAEEAAKNFESLRMSSKVKEMKDLLRAIGKISRT